MQFCLLLGYASISQTTLVHFMKACCINGLTSFFLSCLVFSEIADPFCPVFPPQRLPVQWLLPRGRGIVEGLPANVPRSEPGGEVSYGLWRKSFPPSIHADLRGLVDLAGAFTLDGWALVIREALKEAHDNVVSLRVEWLILQGAWPRVLDGFKNACLKQQSQRFYLNRFSYSAN